MAAAVTKAALSNHTVAFSLRSNGRETLDAPAAVDRGARILQVFGRSTLGELESFEARSGPLRLSGYATRGSVTFPSRRYQYLFVNGRPVEDRALARAMSQASRDAIRLDRHPGVFLYLTAEPGAVDVNVSPGEDAGAVCRQRDGVSPRVPRAELGAARGQGGAAPAAGSLGLARRRAAGSLPRSVCRAGQCSGRRSGAASGRGRAFGRRGAAPRREEDPGHRADRPAPRVLHPRVGARRGCSSSTSTPRTSGRCTSASATGWPRAACSRRGSCCASCSRRRRRKSRRSPRA